MPARQDISPSNPIQPTKSKRIYGPLPIRFWAKVAKSDDGCWIWTAKTNKPGGYGQLHRGGSKGKMVAAHRLAWELSNGDIPAGMCVCHRCDNPLCVNPSHLFLASHAENMADRDAKGRCVNRRGEDHGLSKLSESDIRDIRRICDGGGMRHREIGEKFRVSRSLIGLIARRKIWKHVT